MKYFRIHMPQCLPALVRYAGGIHATMTDPLTTIELETPVHFLAPDGSDLLVEAGTYAIEPAEAWIRLSVWGTA